jgi:Lrp/AsnC family transcriptional regulator for asnA, asnC and gidA
MDKLDKQIIEQLQESHSLTPRVTEIAKRLEKSSTTVHSRIKRMEEMGIIRGYTALIDPASVGNNLEAFFFIKTARGRNYYVGDKVAGEIMKLPHVKNVYNTIGEWDLVVQLVVEDSGGYMDFIRKVEPMDGVRETKGKYILKTYEPRFKRIIPK